MTAPRPAGDERALDVAAPAVAELVDAQAATGPHRGFVEAATGSRRVTYGELRAVTARWRCLLDDLGVARGDAVGIAISDPVDFALVFLGVLAAGRMAAPIDPSGTGREIAAVCGRTRPRLVVADRPAPGDDVEWVTMPPESFTLHEGASEGPAEGAASLAELVARSAAPTGGVVLSTSGTTGAPKVIELTQPALLHAARAVASHHGLTARDRGFNPLPLFHINAEVVGLLSTLVAGATLVLSDRFHRRGFWDLMGRQGITWINAVPAILARIGELVEAEAVPQGIRFARSASAPLPTAVLERFERATGIPVIETYGMTEAASQITANPLHDRRKPGSVGKPVGVEVQIAPGPGLPTAVGPVRIRGASVIRAYASTGYEHRFDPDGWLDTGDLGYVDGDGDLFLVGRADDVINRGGEKIYPREVEDVLLSDPAVVAAAVVGLDHEVLGRVPVAYLVVDGVDGTTDRAVAEGVVARVQARCVAELSRAKRPAAFYVVEALPQGTNGKIRRRAVSATPAIYSLLVR